MRSNSNGSTDPSTDWSDLSGIRLCTPIELVINAVEGKKGVLSFGLIDKIEKYIEPSLIDVPPPLEAEVIESAAGMIADKLREPSLGSGLIRPLRSKDTAPRALTIAKEDLQAIAQTISDSSKIIAIWNGPEFQVEESPALLEARKYLAGLPALIEKSSGEERDRYSAEQEAFTAVVKIAEESNAELANLKEYPVKRANGILDYIMDRIQKELPQSSRGLLEDDMKAKVKGRLYLDLSSSIEMVRSDKLGTVHDVISVLKQELHRSNPVADIKRMVVKKPIAHGSFTISNEKLEEIARVIPYPEELKKSIKPHQSKWLGIE